MRLITFILSSGIVLTCIPACAFAQKVTYSQGAAKHCPQSEGNVDCDHWQPMQPTVNSSGLAPSQRAYGSLWQWQPRRARQPR
jgi:hypothetical protein